MWPTRFGGVAIRAEVWETEGRNARQPAADCANDAIIFALVAGPPGPVTQNAKALTGCAGSARKIRAEKQLQPLSGDISGRGTLFALVFH
jgi:hypothetical protein